MNVEPTEHEKPSTYALYLRPDLTGMELPEWATKAQDFNEVWGGMHMTLCSFALKRSAPFEGRKHGTSMLRILGDFVEMGIGGVVEDEIPKAAWTIPEKARLYVETTRNKLVMVTLGKERFLTIQRACKHLKHTSLVNPRGYSDLHLTLTLTREIPAFNFEHGLCFCPKEIEHFLKSVPQWFIEIEKMAPTSESVQRKERITLLKT